MAKSLTRKKETFVEAYVETGVGAEAARQAFDIDPENNQLAASIGSEYLRKPEIREAIAERNKQREQMVEEAHDSLLTAVRLDYFVFPKLMTDEEIKTHVEAQGLTCLNVRQTEKGKMAFFSLPDGAARGKGIELYHKVQGTFAAEKHLNVNVDVEATSEITELTKQLNELHRGASLPSDGGSASSVGTQTQD